jgi:hypothetical protein
MLGFRGRIINLVLFHHLVVERFHYFFFFTNSWTSLQIVFIPMCI